jgi:hypothetical protein
MALVNVHVPSIAIFLISNPVRERVWGDPRRLRPSPDERRSRGDKDEDFGDAAALSEPRDAIEDIIETFLIQRGFVQRTPRGRVLTPHAFRHLGLAEPAREKPQLPLFSEEEGDVPD